MSTRSLVAVQNRTTLKFRAIYVHNDGAHHLPTLAEHYTTASKRTALLALGDLSQLKASTACPEGHSFDSPVAGHCVAYGRDRGEKHTDSMEFATLSALLAAAKARDADYLYLYQFGRWTSEPVRY